VRPRKGAGARRKLRFLPARTAANHTSSSYPSPPHTSHPRVRSPAKDNQTPRGEAPKARPRPGCRHKLDPIDPRVAEKRAAVSFRSDRVERAAKGRCDPRHNSRDDIRNELRRSLRRHGRTLALAEEIERIPDKRATECAWLCPRETAVKGRKQVAIVNDEAAELLT